VLFLPKFHCKLNFMNNAGGLWSVYTRNIQPLQKSLI
jgi:hypothetical protein